MAPTALKPKPSQKAAVNKPKKPHPDFPLFPHATKRWAKKIKGRLVYFGTWDDPEKALNTFLDQRDDLYAGRKPRVSGTGVTVKDLVNQFLTSKKLLATAGELSPRTFADYHTACEHVVAAFGLSRSVDNLASDDFEQLRASLAKGRGPVSLGNEINRIRVLFKYAFDCGLIDRPVRYGPSFRRPSRKTLRKARHDRGSRMFEAAELKRVIKAAPIHLQAMILLGINCGFGNADVATMPTSALDLKGGWIDYQRPKTAIARRCPLWPETVKALRQAIANRPKPKQLADECLLFMTKYGHPWSRQQREGVPDSVDKGDYKALKKLSDSPISNEMAKLLTELGIKRDGLNFYALRHTFETIGGESRDQVAVDYIMGHARDDMASVYRERISDERLKAVTDHVRKWLWPGK